jgi:hypothetical protein
MIVGKTIIATPTATYIPPQQYECTSSTMPEYVAITMCICLVVLTVSVAYAMFKG